MNQIGTHDVGRGPIKNPRWKFYIKNRKNNRWVHCYTSSRKAEVDAVVEFGNAQPRLFWKEEWEVRPVQKEV